MNVRDKLFELQDKEYKSFSSKLMPKTDPNTVIGVRMPNLRRLSKQMSASGEAREFLSELPHAYFEENNLHAFLIAEITDFDHAIVEIERFLSFVDNWATCDSLRPRVFQRNKERLLPYIGRWLASEHTYTVRFGIECLMCYYLDADFDKKYLADVAAVRSDEYYVNMMIAWYFATALAKQWESAVIYLEERRLPLWVHNKTVSKATESYRISPEKKKHLKSLRRK